MSDRVSHSIFAAIDSGSFKIAKSLCSDQLKRYPNSSYYYALSSYILLLNGERDESIKKSKALMLKVPSDPNALELLNIIFRKTGLYKESIEIYENACKKYPNVPLIESWFELSIKNFDVLSLQKSSMALVQKSSSEDIRDIKLRSSFNYLLASEMNKITKLHKLLFPKLGLKMIESLKSFKNAQELYTYVKLLLLNNEAEKAIFEIKEFLRNEQDLELQIILLDTLDKSGKWIDLFETCFALLVDNKFDDWNTWKYFIKASSYLGKVEDVLRVCESYPVSRNSKLAPFEISKYEKNEKLLSDYLLDYLKYFGGKPCCFADLKMFTDLFAADVFLSIFETTMKENHLQSDLEINKLSLTEVTVLVNHMKFRTILEPEFITSPEYLQKNLEYYTVSEHLLKGKEKTDYFVGNEFLLLICQSILKSSINGDIDVFAILRCIIILEKAAKTDYHEFHLRLWLVRLYSLINCYSIAKAHYTILKVRFVQNDTLSGYLLSSIGTLYPSSVASQDLSKAQDVYSNNQSETTYMLREAYEKNSFSKIKGFIEFGLRLNNSVTKYLNLLETISIARITGNHALFEDTFEEVLKGYNLTLKSSSLERDLDEQLSDNRDFRIIWDFGTHEMDSMLSDKLLGPKRTEVYLKVMISKELLITKNESYGSLESLIDNLRAAEDSPEFSDAEKWELSLISLLVTAIIDGKGMESFNNLYQSKFKQILQFESTMRSSAIHNYFILLKISKSLISIKEHYRHQIDEKLNKSIVIKSKSITKDFKENYSDFKNSNIQTLKNFEGQLTNWFRKDGKEFGITSEFIKDVLDHIKESSNAVISSMKL